MKTSTKALLAVGAIALGATALAGTSAADGRWGHGYHNIGDRGGHWRGGGRGWDRGRGERMFELFDANGDGTITQVEVDEVRTGRLTEFDQNDDGNLTLEEYQALWLDAMRERMVDRFQALDDDGDAIVTTEEFVEPYGRIINRLDRNDDGQVTRDELRRRPRGDGDRDRGDEQEG